MQLERKHLQRMPILIEMPQIFFFKKERRYAWSVYTRAVMLVVLLQVASMVLGGATLLKKYCIFE